MGRTPAGLVLAGDASMLSVMLSIEGGIVRHLTPREVGRWRGRLIEKCLSHQHLRSFS
jgi:hypothetical protein